MFTRSTYLIQGLASPYFALLYVLYQLEYIAWRPSNFCYILQVFFVVFLFFICSDKRLHFSYGFVQKPYELTTYERCCRQNIWYWYYYKTFGIGIGIITFLLVKKVVQRTICSRGWSRESPPRAKARWKWPQRLVKRQNTVWLINKDAVVPALSHSENNHNVCYWENASRSGAGWAWGHGAPRSWAKVVLVSAG